ncbi:hypothetical protein EDD29_6309 [Actinocorallia herbida]|uniref:Uncharacterized protein n=1 Tax=Actinocorallia herbida TaxID=58109 RepID=A0A3N1D509_9ACTN|nr:integrase [Actinocorallia herbida]ROO88635.1 hypothetical protein EDD29_6309 [Actinocorallia herbida]
MKTRLRRLRVGERDHLWTVGIGHVPGPSDCHRCLRLRVWGGGKNSRPLAVDLLSVTGPSPWSACATDNGYPTTRDVRAVIERGLALGWPVDDRGGAFLLSEHDLPDWDLPGFVVTDRLRDPGAADPTLRVAAAYARRLPVAP